MTASATAYRPIGESMTSRQKFVLLNALMLCMFIGALDQAIMATALPKVLSELQGFSLQSWVFTTYLLASTVVVSVVGKLSDMFGRKSFMLAGILIFVSGSMACGAAPSMLFLIAARTVQGVGSGILFACVFATLGDLYTPIERVKVVGYFISNFTVASLTGPTIGGFLTDGPGWRWCFYVNLPVGIVAAIAIWFLMPSARRGGRLADVDFVGALMLAVATVSFMLAIVWAHAAYGWTAPETLGLFSAALVFGALFVRQEMRHPQAILPMFLFRNPVFVQANLIVMCVGGGIFAAMQYLPTFVQTSLGTSATTSGLVSTPQSVGVLVTSIVGGQIVARSGRFKPSIVVGATMILGATVALLTLNVGTPPIRIAVIMAVLGLGMGFVLPMMSTLVQNAVEQQYMGVASSARQFFMQIAGVLGVAILGLFFTTGYTTSFTATVAAEGIALPPAALESFKDPTLALNPGRFAPVREAVLAQPDGRAVLAQAVQAQRQGVADATHRVFLGTAVMAAAMFLLALTMHEVPLRRSFGGAAPSQGREGAEDEPMPVLSMPE